MRLANRYALLFIKVMRRSCNCAIRQDTVKGRAIFRNHGNNLSPSSARSLVFVMALHHSGDSFVSFQVLCLSVPWPKPFWSIFLAITRAFLQMAKRLVALLIRTALRREASPQDSVWLLYEH